MESIDVPGACWSADQGVGGQTTTKLVRHHNLTLLCNINCLPICIFKPERSDYATFRHGHPSRASHRVSGPLKHPYWGLHGPEPIVLAIAVPREQKVCLIAEPNIIREFRLLFDLVLGSQAHHNMSAAVSFYFIWILHGCRRRSFIRILCNEAQELKEPALG